MRHGELVREIGKAAKAKGVSWVLIAQSTKHEKWRCGSTDVMIPRHPEVNDLTGLRIKQALEGELGKGWWR